MPPKTHGPATPGQDTPARTASTISIGRPPSQYESSPLMGSKSSSAARYTSGGRRASTNASGPSGSTVKAESVNGADDECYDDIDDADPLELPAPQRRRQSLRSIVKQRSKYYIPVLDWLAHYDIKLLGGDITAGVTLACLIIPQSMSYASSLAHLTPVAGLWSVAIPGLVYAMLGTCRQLSDGPEAALSLLVGQMVNEVVNGDPHAIPKDAEKVAIQVACVITLQVGVFTFLLGILRLGFLDVVLSRALLRGFITAIGVIIFIEQLLPMLGLSALLHGASSMHPIEKLFFVIEHVSKTNMHTATLSAVALSILIGMRIIKQRVGGWVRYIPEIFLVVVASTVITAMFRLDGHGVDVLGKLQGGIGLPFGMPFRTEYLRHFRRTLPTAAVIAVVGYVDSIVAAKENSAKFGYAISPNRELVALGAGNFFASFLTVFGAVPTFGSITRSRLNGLVGGRSQMATIVTAICAMLTATVFLPYFYYLPKAVLASVITVVVYAILAEAPHDLLFFWKVRAWTDFLQAAMTFVLTLFLDVETGLIASVGFSLILVIQKSTQTRIKIMGRLPDTDEWIPVDEHPEAIEEDMPGVLVVRIRENLNFANTGQLKDRLRRLELYGAGKFHPSEAPKRDSAREIVFHMNDVEEIDASALQIFQELVKSYSERGVGLYFVHLRTKQLEAFEKVGITDMLGPAHFQPDLRSAMRTIEGLAYGNTTEERYEEV